ncbi:MAG: glucosamine-6-phosphate deaminase [Verrucomicrobiae bacterium]|nr:glucosamine-6-phosphate deaminase [Verrucomicrobiae bacterium]
MSSDQSYKPARERLIDSLTVKFYDSHEQMALAAAAAARDHLIAALAAQPTVAVILASAASQIRFLHHLTSFSDVDWSRIIFFHMDEYLGIGQDHPASFRYFLRTRVESRIRPRVFHYIQGDADEPLKECERYTSLLSAQPIDLCCLGIGENGHVAFNDPHVADFDDPFVIKLVKLDEACRRQQVGEGCFPDLAAVPQYAFTLTIPTLCSAKKMICVVPERRKALAVRNALTGPISPACPASVLRRQRHCTLFLDADSASLLEPMALA